MPNQTSVPLSDNAKALLLKEFERPKVVQKSSEEIAANKESYIQIVASFALEGHEPKDFYKVISMERIRGELTPQDAEMIMLEKIPDEVTRIQTKVARLKELGLSWKDL